MMLGKRGQAKRNHCISLDVEDVYTALKLAKATSEFADYIKINRVFLQAADAGFPLIARLHEIKPKEEGSVIVDLKWYDSAGTVYGYSKDVSKMLGVSMFTIHISGGEEMCHAALKGAEDATKNLRRVGEDGIYKQRRPRVIGITELTTSDKENYNELVIERAEQAVSWGLDGIVAAGEMAGELQMEFGSKLIYLFPGMRFNEMAGSGQIHTYSPREVIRDCKDAILISGRAITQPRGKNERGYDFVRKRAHGVIKEIASEL